MDFWRPPPSVEHSVFKLMPVAGGNTLFLAVKELYALVGIGRILIMHSFAAGHLGCFHRLVL